MTRKIVLPAVLMLLCFSCGKSADVIPDVSVNFQSTLVNPALNALRSPGGAVIIPGYGVAGLIIYHELSQGNGSTYVAYDACSTYMPQNKCAVKLDNNSVTVTDPCSGAKFSLSDGGPVKAPAKVALKSYAVNTDGFNIFVSN